MGVALRRLPPILIAVISAAAVLHPDGRDATPAARAATIGGPYRSLLAAAVDLGPADTDPTQLTAALRSGAEPHRLMEWAGRQHLSVRWRAGDDWAVVEGAAAALAGAFGVDVHNYRHRLGTVFYASPQQPAVPAPLAAEVTGLGRILSYSPHTEAHPWPLPREVPDQGLSPTGLLRAYNALPLTRSGITGSGITVVVFTFDGFDQADLDKYSDAFGLPRFTPEVVGGMPTARRGEAAMDLEAVHAVAPDARTVLVNAGPTIEGQGVYPKIAAMMEDTERRFPGAIWSLSIGWACDKLLTTADLAPIRSALTAAHRTGTTAFDASGDLAGLECKYSRDWSGPPGPDDVGLDAVASLPEMTSVGGTTLTTDPSGRWLAERAWFDVPLSQGSGGGVSALFDRPDWQQVNPPGGDPRRRMTPDVAATSDQFTGLKIVLHQQFALGGGTSLAAPVWAGLTALINDFLQQHGGNPVGDLNPLLYRIANQAPRPAFRDITQGANAVARAGPGYDLTTGLGTPDVENLTKDLFVLQKLGS